MLLSWIGFDTIVVALLTLCLWVIVTSCKRKSGSPPGPLLLPVIGNLFWLQKALRTGKKTFEIFSDLSEYYGPIVNLRFGALNIVVINSFDALSESFLKHSEAFAFRPPNRMSMLLRSLDPKQPNPGIVFNNGEEAPKVRRLALTTLRDVGVGKLTLQERVREEALAVVQEISQHAGKPYHEIADVLNMATCNTICSVLFGQRYDYGDEKFKKIASSIQRLFRTSNPMDPGVLFPFLEPFRKKVIDERRDCVRQCFELLDREVEAHRAELDSRSIRDFVDHFLLKENSGELLRAELNLKHSIFDLFVAGTETTASTLSWAIYCCVRMPQFQEVCIEEIERVYGRIGAPNYKQRKEAPFVQAFIHEVLRLYPVGPLGVPRATNRPIGVGDYIIRPQDQVFVNIYAIQRDPKYWDTPATFSPERWLSADGNFQAREAAFLPFGTGRRICLGEQLARMEIFTVFCTLLQHFRFRSHEKFPLPEGGSSASTFQPKPFTVAVEPL